LTGYIIILILALLLLLFLFLRKDKEKKVEPVITPDPNGTNEPEQPVKPVTYWDDIGEYEIVNKTRELPRKTYILGTLYGKYWGEIDAQKEQEYLHSKFFDFHVYEAHIEGSEISRTPFAFVADSGFPRERLPQLFPTIVKKEGKEYCVNIHEPQLADVTFIRKLHQTEGNEVFGTIKARITGYLLDFVTEEYKDKVYRNAAYNNPPVPANVQMPTGKTDRQGEYTRIEYTDPVKKTPVWGDWKFTPPARTSTGEGCLGAGLGIFSVIVGIAFLILLLPRLAIILPFLLIPALFSLIPEKIWKWIFSIIGILLLVGFIIALGNNIRKSPAPQIPQPVVQDIPAERETQNAPVVDTVNNTPVNDTLISHFRSWKDYTGRTYEGKFWIRKSDLVKASAFKDNLYLPQDTESDYDGIIFRLKENDKNSLQGVYQLFDSLKTANKLTEQQFAEMVVSFVQDIPYSIILPGGCDPNLYNDDFVRKYLATTDARCAGYEHFGINTPVEFMADLQGDCDTRTLLIYTVLAHYNYDVALLSSEHYNHSLIGINLPYDGVAYRYGTQQYVMWETTTFIKPGMLPGDITNTDHWRISLKTK
jgi:hypothetical protein